MAARKPVDSPVSAGQRLISELSRPGDPYSLTLLIEQAAFTADHLATLRGLLAGDRDAWVRVRIGAKIVEVVVNNLVSEARQQTELLRRLLGEIHRQRGAAVTPPGGEDDDLAGVT